MDQQEPKKHSSTLNVFIGFPGTGKTTMIQQFIDLEVSKRKGRVLVVTPDPFEYKQYPEVDLKDIHCFTKILSPHKLVYNEPEDIEKIAHEYTGFFNGLLVMDDCRCYMKSNIQEALRKLFIRRRHRAHDIIAAGHGFTEIPPVFFTYANNYALFYTQDNVDRRKEELGASFEAVKQAVNDVNALYTSNEHAYKIIKARNNG